MNYIVFCSHIHSFQPGSGVVQGYCVRINTGAPVPDGADAVVQVEDTLLLHSADEGCRELEIKIMKAPNPGQDIRFEFIVKILKLGYLN